MSTATDFDAQKAEDMFRQVKNFKGLIITTCDMLKYIFILINIESMDKKKVWVRFCFDILPSSRGEHYKQEQ